MPLWATIPVTYRPGPTLDGWSIYELPVATAILWAGKSRLVKAESALE